MTFYNDTQTHTAAQPSRIAAFFDAIALRFRQRRAYHRTLNELSTLTDRDLADLGMSRADFRRISAETAAMVD